MRTVTTSSHPVRRGLGVALVLSTAVLGASCSRPGTGGGGGGGGTGGNAAAVWEADPGLPGHTVYHPRDLAAVTRPMPVVVWGNGACTANGTYFQNFLTPLSAKGVLVLSSGNPNGTGQTNWQQLVQSIDFAFKENTRVGSKYQGKIDTGAISVQGQSCGGLEAIHTSAVDQRVKSTIVWNSGTFATGGMGGASRADVGRLHGPTAWLNGGPSDIAYPQAVADYGLAQVPAVFASYGDVGHLALWTNDANALKMADVAKWWLDATLYNDATAKAKFVGPGCGLCTSPPWTNVQSKNW
jgi:hypothetical protein